MSTVDFGRMKLQQHLKGIAQEINEVNLFVQEALPEVYDAHINALLTDLIFKVNNFNTDITHYLATNDKDRVNSVRNYIDE